MDKNRCRTSPVMSGEDQGPVKFGPVMHGEGAQIVN